MGNILFLLYLDQPGDNEDKKWQKSGGSESKGWQGDLKSEARGIKLRYMKGCWSFGKSYNKAEKYHVCLESIREKAEKKEAESVCTACPFLRGKAVLHRKLGLLCNSSK